MPNIIYPQETFEKQENGAVYSKEGKLQDFPHIGAGIFESWRYNFDNGKQVFRAENSGKVFEKRLIKDQYGNPKWTSWMEIPDAEAHGIQAIAVNDRPLQLPNTDGAIKLQITPEIIDTYTKREIYDLVNSKIEENNNKSITYVSWEIDPLTGLSATDPYRVLQIAFPDGGVKDHFYLVEPHPGTLGVNETASYWIWNVKSTPTPHEDWMQFDNPDYKAFVSYNVYHEHLLDSHVHLSGQFEREYWNQKTNPEDITNAVAEEATRTNEAISGVELRLDTHMEDIGGELSPHLSQQEREDIKYIKNNVKMVPPDGDRYVMEMGEWVSSYEQIETSKKEIEMVWESPSNKLKHGNEVLTGLTQRFNNLLESNKQIIKFSFEFGGCNPLGTNQFFWFETEDGVKSPQYNRASGSSVWDVSIGNDDNFFNSVFIKSTDISKDILVKDIKVYITYRQITGIKFGDPLKVLPINLIGPEYDSAKGIEPQYNGVPFSKLLPDAAHSADWGRLDGDITRQTDLINLMQDALSNKVDHGNMDSHQRFDVYRAGLIPSLIQQQNVEDIVEVLEYGDHTGGGVPIAKGTVIIRDVDKELNKCLEKGNVPYRIVMKIQNVACYENHAESVEGQPPVHFPVYFKTDNVEIDPSHSVGSESNFEWAFNTFQRFTQITLEGYSAELLDKVSLEIHCVKYGDVVFEAPGAKPGDTGYRITINGKDLYLNSSGVIEQKSKGNHLIETANDFTAKAKHNGLISVDNILDIKSGNEARIEVSGLLVDTKGANTLFNTNNLALNTTGKVDAIIGKDLTIATPKINIFGNDEYILSNKNSIYESTLGSRIENSLTSSENITETKDIKAKNFNLDVKEGNISMFTSGFTVETEENTSVKSKNLFATISDKTSLFTSGLLLSAENISIGKTAKNYGIGGDIISVYGQEIDDRYASRIELLKTNAQVAINTADLIQVRRDFSGQIDDEVKLRIQEDDAIRSYATDISGSISGIAQEEATRIADEKIESFLNNLDDTHGFAKDSDVSGYYTTFTHIEENYYDKEYIDKQHKDDIETFDLIINNDEEFRSALEVNGLFEKSKRILFKNGSYHNNFRILAIDFTNIEYIKGETTCTVICDADGLEAPINYDNTIFDGLTFTIAKYITWDPNGRNVKSLDISGAQTVDLANNYSIHEFVIKDNSEITLDNVIDGKEYIFYIQQEKDVKTIKFKNTIYNVDNSSSENGYSGNDFNNGLENQYSNNRTIIKAIGSNEKFTNGLIITDCIYNVMKMNVSGERVNIKPGNLKSSLYGQTDIKYDTVKDIKIVGERLPGTTFTVIASRTNIGWTNQPEGVDDYTVTVSTTKEKLRPQGVVNTKYNKLTTFAIPVSLTPDENGIMPEIIIDYNLAPRMVNIVLAERLKKYVNATSGFETLQAFYSKANVNMVPKNTDNHIIYKVGNGEIEYNLKNGTLPWEFTLVDKDEMIVTPFLYANFKKENLRVIIKQPNPMNFDYNNEFVRGENKVFFEYNLSSAVLDDENFGITEQSGLYGIAPITIKTETFYDKNLNIVDTYLDSVEVESHDRERKQDATITVREDAPDMITLYINWFGVEEYKIEKQILTSVKGLSITYNNITGKVLENVLHSGITKFNTFKANIEWEGLPTHKKGIWNIDNPLLAKFITPSITDIIDVMTLDKGEIRTSFISDFDKTKKALRRDYIRKHATAVKVISPLQTQTGKEIVNTIKWYDELNNEIDKNLITSHSGRYIINEDQNSMKYLVLGEDGRQIFVKNEAVLDPIVGVNVKFRFISDDVGTSNGLFDTQIIAEGQTNIIPGNYWFDIKYGENCNGVTPNNSLIRGGDVPFITIQYKPGNKFNGIEVKDKDTDEIINLVFNTLVDQDSLYMATFTMPYRNCIVTIK